MTQPTVVNNSEKKNNVIPAKIPLKTYPHENATPSIITDNNAVPNAPVSNLFIFPQTQLLFLSHGISAKINAKYTTDIPNNVHKNAAVISIAETQNNIVVIIPIITLPTIESTEHLSTQSHCTFDIISPPNI